MKQTSRTLLALALAFSALLRQTAPTNAQTLNLPLVSNPPLMGTYYSLTFLTNWPPLPTLPFAVPVYLLYSDPTNGPVYVYDDRSVDYDALSAMTAMTTMTPMDANPRPLYGPNDFYLSIWKDTNFLGNVDLALHGTSTNYYELLSKTNLAIPNTTWNFEQVRQGDASTNIAFFIPVADNAPPSKFFRAVSGVTGVSVYNLYSPNPIVEPTSTYQVTAPGYFAFFISQVLDTNLTVIYNLSGSAVNGVDYTNIPPSITIPAGQNEAVLYIQAKFDPKIDFDEQVILSLILTNNYVVNPSAAFSSLNISDNLSNIIQPVLELPVSDLDYYAQTNSIIVSAYAPNWNNGTNYFARIYMNYTTNGNTITTNTAVTDWPGAGGCVDEVRLTVVKTNTGFHVGDVFFTSDITGTIGWISADSSTWSNQWLTITGETNTFRGDIYIDQTGIWGGDLLVVSGESGPLPANRSIWRINTNKVATLVASIPTTHLEGLLTLPNNPSQYGPWAGMLLTADENEGLFYAVDTNGNYKSFALNANGDPIQPSAMKVIPSQANLYFSDPRSDTTDPPLVLKIRGEYFAAAVGDILVTRAGENPPIVGQNNPALFIVHWDNAAQNFIARKIDYAAAPYNGRFIEHAAFTPEAFDLPPFQ